MGRFVIAGYRPKPGQSAALEDLVRRHWLMLRREALVSDRAAYLMRAADGTVVEVFEWLSTHSAERAHGNAAVQAMWAELMALAEPVSLASLPHADKPFTHFEALPEGALTDAPNARR